MAYNTGRRGSYSTVGSRTTYGTRNVATTRRASTTTNRAYTSANNNRTTRDSYYNYNTGRTRVSVVVLPIDHEPVLRIVAITQQLPDQIRR